MFYLVKHTSLRQRGMHLVVCIQCKTQKKVSPVVLIGKYLCDHRKGLGRDFFIVLYFPMILKFKCTIPICSIAMILLIGFILHASTCLSICPPTYLFIHVLINIKFNFLLHSYVFLSFFLSIYLLVTSSSSPLNNISLRHFH